MEHLVKEQFVLAQTKGKFCVYFQVQYSQDGKSNISFVHQVSKLYDKKASAIRFAIVNGLELYCERQYANYEKARKSIAKLRKKYKLRITKRAGAKYVFIIIGYTKKHRKHETIQTKKATRAN